MTPTEQAARVIAKALDPQLFEAWEGWPIGQKDAIAEAMPLAQALADAALLAGEREGFVLVPVDTGPNFSDSTLPVEMIYAGVEVCDQMDDDNANYVAGETTDWDYGMLCVAIYRAMLSARPKEE